MADIKGAFLSLIGKRGTKSLRKGGLGTALVDARASLYKGQPANYKFYPVPVGAQYHYRMRAWNLNTVAYEIWTSTVSPDPNPPSGDPVANVTIIGIWEE